MLKLHDTPSVLLVTAAQRNNGHLLPFATSLCASEDRVRKAVEVLIKSGLVEQQLPRQPTSFGAAMMTNGLS